jgi:hypothetical protein
MFGSKHAVGKGGVTDYLSTDNISCVNESLFFLNFCCFDSRFFHIFAECIKAV